MMLEGHERDMVLVCIFNMSVEFSDSLLRLIGWVLKEMVSIIGMSSSCRSRAIRSMI